MRARAPAAKAASSAPSTAAIGRTSRWSSARTSCGKSSTPPPTKPLYIETGALWMHRGDDAYVRSSLPILKELGFAVDQLTVEDAARRYPQIDFRGVQSVWFERRAGALSARRACIAVRDAFQKAGGSYRTAHVEPGPIVNGSMSGSAPRRWLARRSGCLRLRLRSVARQALSRSPRRQDPSRRGRKSSTSARPRGSERYLPGRLPIWIDFGERIVYGVPDIDGRGFKVADDTRGEPIDPTSTDRTPSAEGHRPRAPVARRTLPRAGQGAAARIARLPIREQSRRPPHHRPPSASRERLARRRRLRPRLQALARRRRDRRRADPQGQRSPGALPSGTAARPRPSRPRSSRPRTDSVDVRRFGLRLRL